MSVDFERLKRLLTTFGQEHLLRFWEDLTEQEKLSLTNDIDSLDLDFCNKSFKKCIEDFESCSKAFDEDLQTVPENVFGSIINCDLETLTQYEDDGFEQISKGYVAALLLAGGQGTRLGVEYPKGMYDVGLPSHKTLFQLMSEKILRLQKLGKTKFGKSCTIPWYIMTSEKTKKQTREYFERNNYFGLFGENIMFFEQGNLPCMDFNGKIILENSFTISKAPDGNGGIYSALQREGLLEDMKRRGVAYVHVFCVDNILIKVADPVFIGFCISKNASCGAKVVEKIDPDESVGIICKWKGKYNVVEYSEISTSTAAKKTEDGKKLLYRAGSIANHFYTVDFLDYIAREKESLMKHHVAKKKIPCIDNEGKKVLPKHPNGIKMEKFVFDVFQYTDNMAVWEVNRIDEFSPLKNSDSVGKDCPSTSRQALLDLHKRWIISSGGSFVKSTGKEFSEDENGKIICEISPLLTYSGEEIEKFVKDKNLTSPFLLEA